VCVCVCVQLNACVDECAGEVSGRVAGACACACCTHARAWRDARVTRPLHAPALPAGGRAAASSTPPAPRARSGPWNEAPCPRGFCSVGTLHRTPPSILRAARCHVNVVNNRTWRGRVILEVSSETISFHWDTHPTVRATANITVSGS
jgi:hypothetical protein